MDRTAEAKHRNLARFVIATSVPYLLISSLTRPTQRYLIPALALFYAYYCLSPAYRGKACRWAMALMLAAYLPVDLALTAHQINMGVGSQKMAQWLKAQNLLEATNPAPIFPNAGQYFYPYGLSSKGKRYVIPWTPYEGRTPIHQEKSEVLGLFKSNYCLYEAIAE